MKTFTTAVAFNTIVQIVGRAVLTVLSLLTVGLLARYLGVTGFGQFQTALSYLAIFTVFADLGFFFILVRDLERCKDIEEKKRFVGNVLSIRIIAGFIVYAFAIAVSYALYKDPIVIQGILLMSVAFFAMSLQNTVIAILQSVFRMEKTVIAEMVGRIVIFLVVYYAIAYSLPITIVFWAYVIGNISNFIVAYFFANRVVPIRLQFDTVQWKQILNESAPLGLAIVLGTLYFKIDSVILSVLKGSHDVGIYAVPYKILEVLLTIPVIFLNTILPIYSRYFQENKERLLPALQRAFDGLFIMAVPIVFGLISQATAIIHMIAGDEYVTATTVSFMGHPATSVTALQILSWAMLINFLNPAFTYLLAAGGLQRKLVMPNVVFLVFNVVANILLIPRGSYVAASFITVITEVLVLITMVMYVKRDLGLSVSLVKAAKTLCSGLAMYGAILILNLSLPMAVVVGGLVYVSLIFILKVVEIREIKAMLGRGV